MPPTPRTCEVPCATRHGSYAWQTYARNGFTRYLSDLFTDDVLFERTLAGRAFEQGAKDTERRVRLSRSHTVRLVTNHADVTHRAFHCARRPNSATLS